MISFLKKQRGTCLLRRCRTYTISCLYIHICCTYVIQIHIQTYTIIDCTILGQAILAKHHLSGSPKKVNFFKVSSHVITAIELPPFPHETSFPLRLVISWLFHRNLWKSCGVETKHRWNNFYEQINIHKTNPQCFFGIFLSRGYSKNHTTHDINTNQYQYQYQTHQYCSINSHSETTWSKKQRLHRRSHLGTA